MVFTAVNAGELIKSTIANENWRHFGRAATDFIPMTVAGLGIDATYDMGTSLYRWKNIYFSGKLIQDGVEFKGGATGLEIAELLTISSKNSRQREIISNRNIIAEGVVSNDNFTGSLAGNIAQGGTTILITPTITGQEPPTNVKLRLVKASSGDYEDVVIVSGTAGTYTLESGIALVGGFSTSDKIQRNFCNIDTGLQSIGFLSTETGDASLTQVHHGEQICTETSKTNAEIEWSAVLNTPSTFTVDSIDLSPTNKIYLQSVTDRSAEFSTSAPNNKILLIHVRDNGQKGIMTIGSVREYTITVVGAHASSKIPLTVSGAYLDAGVSTTGGTDGITAPSANGLDYWVCVKKDLSIELSFVSLTAVESFVASVIKRARYDKSTIPAFMDDFNRSDGSTGNDWTVIDDAATGTIHGFNIVTNVINWGCASGANNGLQERMIRDNEKYNISDYEGYDIFYKFKVTETAAGSTNAHSVAVASADVAMGTAYSMVPVATSGVLCRIELAGGGTNCNIYFHNGATQLANAAIAITRGADYYFRVQITRTTIRFRKWLINNAEPGTWDLEFSQLTPFTNSGDYFVLGNCVNSLNSAVENYFDNLIISRIGGGVYLSGAEAKSGQLASIKTEIYRTTTNTNPVITSKSLSIYGG